MDKVDLIKEEMQVLGEQKMENNINRLSRKLREDPFFGYGLLGLVAVIAVGAYGVKRRTTPIGLYLMQLRVLAEGALVTGLAAGVGVNLLRNGRRKLAAKPKVVWL